jgi:hypothetical protein
LFLFKDTDFLRCKIIAIDGAKAERIAGGSTLQLNLDVDNFTVLVDKSYQNGRKLPNA